MEFVKTAKELIIVVVLALVFMGGMLGALVFRNIILQSFCGVVALVTFIGGFVWMGVNGNRRERERKTKGLQERAYYEEKGKLKAQAEMGNHSKN